MKIRNRFILIIISVVITLGVLTGCTAIKNGVKDFAGWKYIIQGETDISDSGQQDSSSASVDKGRTSQPTPPVKAAPTKAPTSKTSSFQVNVVTAKSVPSEKPGSGTVSVSTMDSFTSLVVSDIEHGNDLNARLGSNIQTDGIIDRVKKIMGDYGYSGYISGLEYNIDGSIIYVHFNYKDGREHFLSRIGAVNSKVGEIVSALIKSGMSQYEKELALHDYVVNRVKYDYKNMQNNTIPDDSYTAYGALINGTAVCQGYSEAIYRLLNKAGVKCILVTGSAGNVSHAWNMVSIGGAYYHLDATFDDPVSSSGDMLTYNYFNLTDASISKDHSWDKADYPQCTSTAANYFVINKLIANSKSEFYDIVKKGLLSKLQIIRCRTASYDPKTYSPNIISQILRDNPNINYVDAKSGYSYDYDRDLCVMDFYMKYK